MARKETTQSKGPDRPNLVVSRSEAEEKIKAQIYKGRQIINEFIPPDRLFFADDNHRDKTKNECSKWSTYNIALLKSLFSDDSIASEYTMLDVFQAMSTTTPKDLRKRIEKGVARLESILERLELIPELTQESHDELNAATTDKGYSEKSSQSITLKAAKITFVASVIALIGAVLTSPLWIPVINKIFGDSGETTKISDDHRTSRDAYPEDIPSGPNRPAMVDYNAPGSKQLHAESPPIIGRGEELIQPEEIEGDVNRPKISPIFKIPDAAISPEETVGEVNEPKIPELIKRKEKPIEPEDK